MGPDPLLAQAWTALDGDPAALDRVRLTGDVTGLLPSTLAALPAMVAAVSASTLAAAVLDGRSGPVTVDVEHVALAAGSERHARVPGAAAADPFAPLSRFWRTADGWARLHANYSWHRERALQVLGVPSGEPAEVEAAVAGWRGADLEDALAAAGALGFAVRTPAQWAAHPHGRAVAAQPLLTWTDGPDPGRAVRPAPGRAATGVRVLDLTRVIAGPVATRTLAAWGADVLRLDVPRLPEIPSQALDTLSGKRSAGLDLAAPAGRRRLEDLLAAADVLVHGYRPGALAAYGIGPELAARHPHLVTVSLSAWGPLGPWAGRRGFDSLVQCPTGIAAAEGTAERPGALPAQVLDHGTGYLVAAAALLGVARVRAGGPARSAQFSLAQTAHWLTAAGSRERLPAREVDPAPYLVTLPGARRPVQVVAPPGRAGDLVPRWAGTTDLLADEPSFG